MSGIGRSVKKLIDKSRIGFGLKSKPKKRGPIRPLTSDEIGAVGASVGEDMSPSVRRKRKGRAALTLLGGEEEGL